MSKAPLLITPLLLNLQPLLLHCHSNEINQIGNVEYDLGFDLLKLLWVRWYVDLIAVFILSMDRKIFVYGTTLNFACKTTRLW